MSLTGLILSQDVRWRFKFSQLKGSSDDGRTQVKLLFQHPGSGQIDVKVGESTWPSAAHG